MLNVFKKVKDFFSSSAEKEEVLSEDRNRPGQIEFKKEGDEKIFEDASQIREGVGQSSTSISSSYSKKAKPEPPETPVKLHHGIRKRKNVVNVSSESDPIKKINPSKNKRNNKYRNKYKHKSK